MCDLLVLDDDPLVRMMLVEALCDEGLDAVGAAAEAEALHVLRFDEPCVFVTDLDLGTKRNGFVVAAIVRTMLPHVPIIYITGRPESLEGRILGAWESVMHKPFRPSDLMATVHRLLERAPDR